MKTVTQTLNTLEAGQVQRFHAHPAVTRKQSVGEHTWGLSIILLHLLPNCPDTLAEAMHLALLHDAAEIVTGDIPFTVKLANPGIKAALADMETTAHMGLLLPIPSVRESAEYAVKMADMLEGLWYCSEHERGAEPAAFNNWLEAIENYLPITPESRVQKLVRHNAVTFRDMLIFGEDIN